MTFEKEDGDPIATREHEHFTSMWASLAAGAAARSQRRSPAGTPRTSRPTRRASPGSSSPTPSSSRSTTLLQPVPDVTVRSYFLLERPGSRSSSSQLLVRRLQRMDVDGPPADRAADADRLPPVRRPAPAATTLPGRDVLDPDGPGPEALGPGDAQRGRLDPVRRDLRRHGLEQPAADEPRRRLERRRSCRRRPRASSPRSGRPTWALPASLPSIGLFEIPNSTRGFEAAGQTRYLFHDVWDLPSHDVTADDILAGLPGTDVARHPRRLHELRAPGARREGQEGAPRLGQRRRPARRLAGRRAARDEGRDLDDPVLDVEHERTRDADPRLARTRRARSRPGSAGATGSCTRTTRS